MEGQELELVYAFETHSVDEIRALLDSGVDPVALIDGKAPLNWLTEMYSRSDQFPACVQLMLDRGAVPDDPAVVPILLDDAVAVIASVGARRDLLTHRMDMMSCFTPLIGASLLHVAAEYGNFEAARTLIELGADVNAVAAVDENGLNGQTPLFHTVNSSWNRSVRIMRLLLDAGAKVDVRLEGITWGKGFDWETTLFDVTPVSYAQFGLLPQVHRRERDIYDNIASLLEAAGRPVPPLENIPNKYLEPKAKS
ncbi:MAG: ankyrin repeat domain-containing protein [Acidobacteriota bacterium]